MISLKKSLCISKTYPCISPWIIKNNNNNIIVHKSFHNSMKLLNFWEYDRKLGYPHISDHKEEKLNPFQRIYKGYFQFVEESKKLKNSLIDSVHMDPNVFLYPDEIDVQWKFNGDPNLLEKWIISCDSDFSQGYSKAGLSLSPTGTGIFSGTLETRIPKDGKIADAGFCNIRSVQERGPFLIEKPLEWSRYTHLILRIRGDGRTYMINLHLKNQYDIMWGDLHSFPLYTRGGPYWQYVKIPFSKFLLSSRGKIQDSQMPIRLLEVLSLSITASGIPGPFALEIDYIGLERDPSHNEEFAYEMYKPPHPFYI